MKQLLSLGVDGRLAELLRELAQAHGVWLRELSQGAACVGLLRQGEESILVLKLGRDLDKEMSLLEEITRAFPATAVVVVGPSEHPALAALAWDLGAFYVSFPPQPLDKLRAVLAHALGI